LGPDAGMTVPWTIRIYRSWEMTDSPIEVLPEKWLSKSRNHILTHMKACRMGSVQGPGADSSCEGIRVSFRLIARLHADGISDKRIDL
jgi:hypothetical protein